MTRARLQSAVEILFLVTVMVAVGFQLVPCHSTSTFADREFTGWVVPVANRLADQRLYSDGAHSPMAPLPFLVSRAVFGSHGTWISESLLNFAFQCLETLLLYAALSRANLPAPFLIAACSFALFLYLPKSILYDAVAQTAVAGVLVSVPAILQAVQRRTLAILAATTVLALLAKQNTGGGVAIGVCVALLMFPASLPLAQRVRNTATYLGLLLLAFAAACLLLLPWVDVRGMVVDVFLTGSEPKGGAALLLVNLGKYAREVASSTSWRILLIATAAVIGVHLLPPVKNRLRGNRGWIIAATVIGVVCGVGVTTQVTAGPLAITLPGFSVVFRDSTIRALQAGLIASFVTLLTVRISKSPVAQPIAALTAITLPAAICHSLSVSTFRWTYDNNPMIAIALATLCAGAWCAVVRLPRPLRKIAVFALCATISLAFWSTTSQTVDRIRHCVQAWPEVAYLHGARLPLHADLLRNLVDAVKSVSTSDDSVLLMPEDPNLFSWFERKRPKLTSAILFPDQYWPRFADEDFKRVANDPPKVIVLGPLRIGELLQHAWKFDSGSWLFKQRVLRELVASKYHELQRYPIQYYLGTTDEFVVFVRNGSAPQGTALQPALPSR